MAINLLLDFHMPCPRFYNSPKADINSQKCMCMHQQIDLFTFNKSNHSKCRCDNIFLPTYHADNINQSHKMYVITSSYQHG